MWATISHLSSFVNLLSFWYIQHLQLQIFYSELIFSLQLCCAPSFGLSWEFNRFNKYIGRGLATKRVASPIMFCLLVPIHLTNYLYQIRGFLAWIHTVSGLESCLRNKRLMSAIRLYVHCSPFSVCSIGDVVMVISLKNEKAYVKCVEEVKLNQNKPNFKDILNISWMWMNLISQSWLEDESYCTLH